MKKTIHYKHYKTSFSRDARGVPSLQTAGHHNLAFSMGYAHANDRIVQMILVRTIGQGRLCELLIDDDETLVIDCFMREMGLYFEAKNDAKKLQDPYLSFAQAYCDGVNYWLDHHRRPFEFMLTGFYPEPWCIADTLLTIKLMAFMGLAQTQGDLEKLIIQLIKDDASIDQMRDLFSPHLDGLDENLIGLIKKLKFVRGFIAEKIPKFSGNIQIKASNNWVLSGQRSVSGHPLSCHDPHLEVNRLPPIWHELICQTDVEKYLGATMPGVPGVIMGRSAKVSFGFTYGFMDVIDYFIEEIKDNKARVDGEFVPLEKRVEIILRKKHSPFELNIFETSNGILEFRSLEKIKITKLKKGMMADGYYLSMGWSGHKNGSQGSLEALYDMLEADNVLKMQAATKKVTISCNWLLADIHGDIAFQQSGLLPQRSKSGLFPLLGTDSREHWQGLLPSQFLASELNPANGILVTANHDLNQLDKALSITAPMGPYRQMRIVELLSVKEKYLIKEMQEIQRDVHSVQARLYLDLLRDAFQESEKLSPLLKWDCCYGSDSMEASLFERFYHYLLQVTFSGPGKLLDSKAFQTLMNKTGIFADYYYFFDKILLNKTADDPIWFAEESRDQCIQRAMQKTLENPLPLRRWGEMNSAVMKNIFFDGKLPGILGLDHGPIPIVGNRATIVQGGLFKAHGRETTFCPSYRFICDLGENGAYTILAGGVSGNRFSRYYKSELDDWLNFRYKKVEWSQ